MAAAAAATQNQQRVRHKRGMDRVEGRAGLLAAGCWLLDDGLDGGLSAPGERLRQLMGQLLSANIVVAAVLIVVVAAAGVMPQR